MNVSNGLAWTDEELATLDRVYPDGGADAALEAMPYRSRASIMQRASLRGLRLNKHGGGKSWTGDEMRNRMAAKPETGYPWPPLSEMDRAAMSWFGWVNRAGQLRPSVGFNNREQAA